MLMFPVLLAVAGCGPDPVTQAVNERSTESERMFQERCKRAGEFIYRTADNVEGIFLMKLRPEETNYGDRYAQDFDALNDAIKANTMSSELRPAA